MCCIICLWCYFVPSVLGFTSRYAWVHSVDLVFYVPILFLQFFLCICLFFCLIALFSCFKLILSPHSIVSLFCYILLMIVPFFVEFFFSLCVSCLQSCSHMLPLPSLSCVCIFCLTLPFSIVMSSLIAVCHLSPSFIRFLVFRFSASKKVLDFLYSLWADSVKAEFLVYVLSTESWI